MRKSEERKRKKIEGQKYFLRTCKERHEEGVRKVVRRIEEK